jgi:CspA family cold shock protein
MSSRVQSVVCQHCGRGFVLIKTYLDFLTQRGVKVKVPMLCMTCFLKKGPLPKQRGEVKWFNLRKRHGFIVTREGEEIFVHQQQIIGNDKSKPHKGQTVLFHKRYAVKGPEALNVELIQE